MQFALLVSLAPYFASSLAHIFSITGPANYVPTANSSYPLTFLTANSPITNEDFSVAIGLDFASTVRGPTALGNFFIQNIDLENTGHGSQLGNFTLPIPLPASKFPNNGQYVITAAVTNAVGALWNVQLLFFNLSISVTGVPGSPTTHAIHPGADSTKCLSVGAPTNGSAVTIQTCSNTASGQQWAISDGTLQVTIPQTGAPPVTLCLDVTNGSTANGNKMQVWSCFPGNTNQQFSITADNHIAWTNMGECLDLTDGNTTPGTAVQMWQCTDNDLNQVWNIV